MTDHDDAGAAPTYAALLDAAYLAEARVTDLLQMAAQTRWSRRDAADPADRYDGDLTIAGKRIAGELARRNDLRRRHPAPTVGSAVVVSEEPTDWPFPACEVAPGPGTTGTVVPYRAVVAGPRRRAWEIRVARRFYVALEMGDDFGHAPGSTFPVPVWQVAAVGG